MKSRNSVELSVVMAVYNDEKFVGKAIESILIQSYTDFELIIVDDGSTDDSGNIIDRYALQDSRITVIHQENKGVAESRNRGINIATGKYITIHDSDDISLPERFKIQMNYLKNSDIALIACNNFIIDESDNIVSKTINHGLPENSLSSGRNPFAHGTVITIREKLLEVGCYDPFYIACEDFVIWLKFLEKGYKMYKLDYYLYKYRIRNNSAGQRTISTDYNIRAYKNYMRRIKDLPEDFSPIIDHGKQHSYSFNKKLANAIFWEENYKRYRSYYIKNITKLYDSKILFLFFCFSMLPSAIRKLLKICISIDNLFFR